MRNVLIAIGNSGNAAFLPRVERHLRAASPLVRGAAVWALWRLSAPGAFRDHARAFMADETDETVRDEWSISLASSGSAPANAAAPE